MMDLTDDERALLSRLARLAADGAARLPALAGEWPSERLLDLADRIAP